LRKQKLRGITKITIPALIRKRLGLKVGDTLIVRLEGDMIILEPKKRSITEIRIRLGRPIDWRYVEETIREEIGKE